MHICACHPVLDCGCLRIVVTTLNTGRCKVCQLYVATYYLSMAVDCIGAPCICIGIRLFLASIVQSVSLGQTISRVGLW